MCGIAGVIHRNGNSKIGEEMSSMLQAMKHRGLELDGLRFIVKETIKKANNTSCE